MLDAVGRFNGDHLDTARVDGNVVMEGCLIKVAVDRAEVGEIGSATSQGKHASARRRLARRHAEQTALRIKRGDKEQDVTLKAGVLPFMFFDS